MKKLQKYLKGRSKGDFARSVGIHPGYLSHLLAGIREPSLPLMRRIQSVSGGVVDLNSWSLSDDNTQIKIGAAPADVQGVGTGKSAGAAS